MSHLHAWTDNWVRRTTRIKRIPRRRTEGTKLDLDLPGICVRSRKRWTSYVERVSANVFTEIAHAQIQNRTRKEGNAS